MPHKRNPVDAVLARACARRAHALRARFTRRARARAGRGRLARGVGAARATRSRSSGGAAAAVRAALEGLEVDAERMRANVRPETHLGSGASCGRRPSDYLGAADAFVDRALAAYREELA